MSSLRLFSQPLPTRRIYNNLFCRWCDGDALFRSSCKKLSCRGQPFCAAAFWGTVTCMSSVLVSYDPEQLVKLYTTAARDVQLTRLAACECTISLAVVLCTNLTMSRCVVVVATIVVFDSRESNNMHVVCGRFLTDLRLSCTSHFAGL